MKKKITITLVALFLVVAGGAVGVAASNYYAGMVYSQQEQIESDVEDYYTERNAEIGEQVHHDMVLYVDGEVSSLRDRLYSYVETKLNASDRLNEHTAAVDEAIKQVESEIKALIDSME